MSVQSRYGSIVMSTIDNLLISGQFVDNYQQQVLKVVWLVIQLIY